MNERHILKVPKGSSIGMPRDLFETLHKNERVECFGTIRVPGYGNITGDDTGRVEVEDK